MPGIKLDQDYVFIPQRLLADLQANPAAIGVYALIARLFLIYQEPIPLSAADLQRYDPTLSYGAARGALQRLTALHWLTDQSGHKNCYTPTWGAIKGATQPWQMDAPTLGRPAHVTTMRLDRRLLDVGLGKLIPHQTYPAQTSDRYLEQPILSLRDVGVYAQALAGWSIAPTAALLRYELICEGQAQPLPSAEVLIALASQRTLAGDGASPTEHGLRKLGLNLSSSASEPTPGQPLFFVDHGLIPDPIICSIPALIPSSSKSKGPSSAAERARPEVVARPPRMAGTPGILRETSESPSNLPTHPTGVGGGDLSLLKKEAPTKIQPETAASWLLRSIHAFPSSIVELADMPIELVGRAIAYAETEPGIESIPGWVVDALRRHRDEGWPIPAPRTRPIGTGSRDRSIDIEQYTCGAYGDLFRLGSDTTGLEVSSCDTQRDDNALPAADVPVQFPEEDLMRPDQCLGAPRTIGEANGTAGPLHTESADEVLTHAIQADLMVRCGRRYGRVIEGLRVHVAGGTSVIICAAQADLAIVQRELIGALQQRLRHMGAPLQLRWTTQAGWEASRRAAGNAWIRPAAQQRVPPGVQA